MALIQMERMMQRFDDIAMQNAHRTSHLPAQSPSAIPAGLGSATPLAAPAGGAGAPATASTILDSTTPTPDEAEKLHAEIKKWIDKSKEGNR